MIWHLLVGLRLLGANNIAHARVISAAAWRPRHTAGPLLLRVVVMRRGIVGTMGESARRGSRGPPLVVEHIVCRAGDPTAVRAELASAAPRATHEDPSLFHHQH